MFVRTCLSRWMSKNLCAPASVLVGENVWVPANRASERARERGGGMGSERERGVGVGGTHRHSKTETEWVRDREREGGGGGGREGVMEKERVIQSIQRVFWLFFFFLSCWHKFFFICALSFVISPDISAQNVFLLSLSDFIGSRFLYVRYTISSKHACHMTVGNSCNMTARHDVCSMNIVLPDQVRSLPPLAFVVVVFAFVSYWNILVSYPRLRRYLRHCRFRAAKAPCQYVSTFSVDLETVDLDRGERFYVSQGRCVIGPLCHGHTVWSVCHRAVLSQRSKPLL